MPDSIAGVTRNVQVNPAEIVAGEAVAVRGPPGYPATCDHRCVYRCVSRVVGATLVPFFDDEINPHRPQRRPDPARVTGPTVTRGPRAGPAIASALKPRKVCDGWNAGEREKTPR